MPKRKCTVEVNLDGSGKGESKKKKIGNFRTIIKLKRKCRSAVSSVVKDNSPRNDYLMRRIETGKKPLKFYVRSEMQHDFFERSQSIPVETPVQRRLCFTLNGQKNPRPGNISEQTSSISYVEESESRHQHQLPPIVYRPPKYSYQTLLSPMEYRSIEQFFQNKIKDIGTITLLMPLYGNRSEFKKYLLEKGQRLQWCKRKNGQNITGRSVTTGKKAYGEKTRPLFLELQPKQITTVCYPNSIICLHYKLGNVQSYNEKDQINMNTDLVNSLSPIVKKSSIEESNLQVVFECTPAIASKRYKIPNEQNGNDDPAQHSFQYERLSPKVCGLRRTPLQGAKLHVPTEGKICKLRCEMYLSKSLFNKISNTLKCKLLHLIRLLEFHSAMQFNLQKTNYYNSLKKMEEEKLKTTPDPVISQSDLVPETSKELIYLNYKFVKSRDTFEHKLYFIDTLQKYAGKNVLKRKYYFKYLPKGYNALKYREKIVEKTSSRGKAETLQREVKYQYPVGITTYKYIYDEKQLLSLENHVDELIERVKQNRYLPNTYHTIRRKTSKALVRTKMFFNARYLWGNVEDDMKYKRVCDAKGIRVDVSKAPEWFISELERPLIECGAIPKDIVSTIPKSPEKFINSFACNVYHDGTCGLAAHFDDKERFDQPVSSLRLFSDCRLSFGSKTYAGLDSSFFIPMLRGDVTIMEKDGYAINDIKHCIRASDMVCKSAVLLLRRIHPDLLSQATFIHVQDFVQSFSRMTLDDCKEEKDNCISTDMKCRVELPISTNFKARRFTIGDDVVIKHVTRSVLNEMIEEIQCAMKIAPIYTIQSVIRDIQGVRQNLFLNKTTH